MTSNRPGRFVELAEAGVSVLDCEHKTPPAAAEGHPYIAIPNLVDGRLDIANVRRISDEHFREWTRRTRPQAGDVIVSRRGRVGDTAVIPNGLDCAIGQNLVILRSSGELVDPRFLRWAARGPLWAREVDRLRNVGAVFDSLNVRDIGQIRIPVPPLNQQRAIAAFLGSLDDKITSNLRLAGLLEKVAGALFEARFVDFVGTDNAVKTEIGRLPRGWDLKPFSEAVQINPKVRLRKGEVTPFVAMADVAPWETRPRDLGERPYQGGSRFEPGDTLMARITGCIEHGKGAFVDFVDGPAAGSTEFLVLRPRAPLTPEAVFFLSRTRHVRAHAISNMTGSSGRQRVQTAAFDDLQVAIPPDLESWTETAALLRTALAQGRALWQERRTLSALRDSVLPKLISGEIRAPRSMNTDETIGVPIGGAA